MNIQDQRKAIYTAESDIEEILDVLRSSAKLIVNGIGIQNVMDDDHNVAPALKVNLSISKLNE